MDKNNRKKQFIGRPRYPGGPRALRDFIGRELRYPEAARAAGIEGTVHLRYGIDHRGAVEEVRVIAGIGHGCDEEAVRLVRLLLFDMPKSPRGLRVLFHKTISIHFRLPKPASAAPPPQEFTVQYSITPTPSPSTEDPSPGEEEDGYSYTISW